MTAISVPTLTLATGVVGLAVTVGMALLVGRQREATGYVALMRGIALHAAGLVVLGFEAEFADGVGVAVASTFMAIAQVFYVQAIARLTRRSVPLRPLSLLAAAVIVGVVVFVFVIPSPPLRLAVFGAHLVLTQAIAVGLLANGLRHERTAAYRAMFGLVVAISIASLWRTLWAAVDPDPSPSAGVPDTVLLMTSIVFFSTMGLAWVSVLEDRYRRSAEAARLELSRIARTDDLTGLANRRHFDDVVAAEVARSVRYGRPLALVAFDVDHFEAVNDTFGHAEGNRVLRRVATMMRSTARANDVAARLGDEEFVLVLPETGLGDGERIADRVRRRVRDANIPSGRDDGPLTVSAGVAALVPSGALRAAVADAAQPAPLSDELEVALLEALIDAADAALYAAKRAGRDHTVVADAIVGIAPDAERTASVRDA